MMPTRFLLDFRDILRTPVFHFLVCHNKNRVAIHVAIHTGLLEELSPPLHALVTNGMMKESVEGIAVLEEVEEKVFIGFCEFAYRGTYTTPYRKSGGLFAFVTDDDFSRMNINSQLSNGTVTSPANSARYPYDQLWSKFSQLKFPGDMASLPFNPDLVFYGKLYVFADLYLVDSLRTQCLKTLHQDLCNLSLNEQNVPHVLDLLEYVYRECGRDAPRGQLSVRDLVIDYATCKVSILAQYPRFQSLLDTYSEMGSDLVMRLVKSLE